MPGEILDESPGKPRGSWPERRAEIARRYPSVDNLDWSKAFTQDPGLMGNILHDILRADQGEGREGRRPHQLEGRPSELRLRQIMGEDHTCAAFPDALAALANGMRLSTLARKTDISKTQVWRLLRAQIVPSREEMEKIAKAFKRDPSYFAEWRRVWLIALLSERLEGTPEATVGIYKRLSGLRRL